MRAVLVAAVALAFGCGGGGAASDAADAAPDAVAPRPDGAEPDAGPDAQTPDAAEPDAGADAQTSDAQTPDAEPDPGPISTVDEALDGVDVFLGTGGLGFSYAALTPAAQVPLGMVRLGPDTSQGLTHFPFHHFSGYHFDDTDVRGFSHTHFVGTGVPDFGNFRFLPVDAALAEGDAAALFTAFLPFDKASERGSPGRYAVRLPRPGVEVELTASTRGGVQRYTFDPAAGQAARLFFNVSADAVDEGSTREAEVRRTADGLEGTVLFSGSYTRTPFHLHFSAAFDPPPSAIRAVGVGEAAPPPEAATWSGVPAGALLVWDPPPADGIVTVRTGLSYVSVEKALASRAAELDGRSFDEVADAARALWREKLGAVAVAGGTPEQRRTLFTAQYNCYRMPTRQDDVDGELFAFDQRPRPGAGFAYYSDLSLWDTFRTLHPWYSLTDHGVQRDVLRSLTLMRDLTGGVPRWPAATAETGGMLGSSGDVLFADAAVKGVEGVDYESVFQTLAERASAPAPPGAPGREDVAEYVALGYVPFEAGDDSVSVTLEYANDDNALAHLAEHLGHAEQAATFRERAGNWRNLFDPEYGFLFARDRAGALHPVRPEAQDAGMYVEGTAWQWTFFVPQDPAGLGAAFGGPAAFGEKLETLFSKSALGQGTGPIHNRLPDSYYWHGNEPVIQAAYFFNYTDRPARRDFWLREIQTRIYTEAPDGLPGNDDGGTMSSWYLFSAAGLYPIAGTPQYMLGTPLFPRLEIRLAGGATLRIVAPGASAERRYVRSVALDGVPVQGPTLDHARLAGGAELRFEMADTP